MPQANVDTDFLKTIYSMKDGEKANFKSSVKEFIYNIFAGLFVKKVHLKDTKQRIAWRLINYYLPQHGELALIQKGTNNEYFIAEILDKKCSNCSDKLKKEHLKIKLLNSSLDGKEIIEHDPSDYVIFKNNPLGEQSFSSKANAILDRLVKVWEALAKDIEVSQGNIFIEVPFIADEKELKEKTEKLSKAIKSGEFLIVASMDGISPFRFREWKQESKALILWEQFNNSFSLLRRLLGVRHFTYKKKERLTSAEAEANEEQFEYIENNMWESRLSALEECKEKWSWNYVLLEDEEEILRKQLRVLKLKAKIKGLKKNLEEPTENEDEEELEAQELENENQNN
jgi:hypothetical protein